jgi:hypothetical protein
LYILTFYDRTAFYILRFYTAEPCHNTSQTDDPTPGPSEPEQTEEKDMTVEEAQNILMKALKQIVGLFKI